jgi:hypothetical protein
VAIDQSLRIVVRAVIRPEGRFSGLAKRKDWQGAGRRSCAILGPEKEGFAWTPKPKSSSRSAGKQLASVTALGVNSLRWADLTSPLRSCAVLPDGEETMTS